MIWWGSSHQTGIQLLGEDQHVAPRAVERDERQDERDHVWVVLGNRLKDGAQQAALATAHAFGLAGGVVAALEGYQDGESQVLSRVYAVSPCTLE